MSTENVYAIKYIRSVTTRDNMPAPDSAKAGKHMEVLSTLYDMNRSDGKKGAAVAWRTLNRMFPELDKPRKLFYIHELNDMPAPEYVHPDYPIYQAHLNLLYGAPGAGKSFVAVDFACKVAAKYPQKVVIYATGEGITGMNLRVRAWEQMNETSTKNLMLYQEAVAFSNPVAMQEFLAEIELMDVDVVFLIIDTLARSFDGGNENDASAMQSYVSSTEDYMRDTGVGILIVHHTNRMGTYRGSSALHGGVDSMLALTNNDGTISVFNSAAFGGKNKHRKEAETIHLSLLSVHLSDENLSDEQRKQAAVTPALQTPYEDKNTLKDTQRELLETLAVYGDEGQSAAALIAVTESSKPTVYRHLKRLITSGYVTYSNEIYRITQAGNEVINN